MPTRYQINVELFGEVLNDILVEGVADTSLGVLIVLVLILLWVSPQQVAEKALVRNVARPFDHFYVAVFVELLTQTAMHAENFVVDQCSDWGLFENADKFLEQPTVLLVLLCEGDFGLALPFKQGFVEAIDVGETMALVVAAEEEEILRVLHLEREKQKHGLNLHRATTLIVAEEEVVRFGRPALHVEYFSEVVELPVDVANYLDRRLQLQKDGLILENVLRREAQLRDVFLADLDVFRAVDLLRVDSHLLVLLEVEVAQRIDNAVGHEEVLHTSNLIII